MSTLLMLHAEDFEVKVFGSERKLCTHLAGFSLLFFKVSNCQYCANFSNDFMQLTRLISGCQFGVANLSDNNRRDFLISQQSQDTAFPINEVPTFIMYVNGIPISKYDMNYALSIENMRNWIINESNRVRMEFASQAKGRNEATTGLPLFGSDDGLIYPQYCDAY